MSSPDSGLSRDALTDWLTLAEAAERLDVSVRTVRRRVRAGELTGAMTHDPAIGADRWMIDPQSLPQTLEAGVLIPMEVLDRIEDAYREAADANARAEVAERVAEFEKERRTETEAERDSVKDSHDKYRESAEAERDELQARIADLEARRWWQRRPPVPTHDDPSTDRLHRL